jgi:transposase
MAGRTLHRWRSLTEKLEIVRESLIPGASAAAVSKAHGISLSMLYRWRKAYRDMIATDLTLASGQSRPDDSVAGLRLQVRNLERLLGQRTLEIALLRERLGLGLDHGSEP